MAPRVSLAALGLLVALSGAVAAAPWAGKGAAAKSPPPPVAKPVPAAPAKIEVAADKPPTVAAPHNVYWRAAAAAAARRPRPLAAPADPAPLGTTR